MIRLLRQLFNPNAKNQRRLSGLLGALLLFSILLSSFFVIAEADHDCRGDGCPVCMQIQCCLDGWQQTGAPINAGATPVLGEPRPFEPPCAADYRAPSTTLQSLYVRMDE